VLKSAPSVKVFEEIAFVGLVPTDLVRRQWANVQAIDLRGVDESLDQFWIFGDCRHDEARAEFCHELILRDFHNGGKREKVFPTRQRVIRVTTDDSRV
jgi:hypothetical protein